MKRCSYCGAQNEDENLFCTECGKELPKGFVCPSCGTCLDVGDTFCSNCGRKIEEQVEPDITQSLLRKCPYCGTVLDEDDMFCSDCGKKVEEHTLETQEVQQRKCYNCGVLLEEDDEYCPNCGEKYEFKTPSLGSDNNETSDDETKIENTREDSKPILVDNESNSMEGREDDGNIIAGKAKTMNLRKLFSVVAGLIMLAVIGYGCWYGLNMLFDNQQSANKDSVNQESSYLKDLLEPEIFMKDYLEKARQGSIDEAKQDSIDKVKQTVFLENFYKNMDNLSWEQKDSYIRKLTTSKALQTLKEYDYDCEGGDCLAIWMFLYQPGTDCGGEEIINRVITWVDSDTYMVHITYKYGDNDTCEYRVKIGLTKDGDAYKIDTIINVQDEEKERLANSASSDNKQDFNAEAMKKAKEIQRIMVDINNVYNSFLRDGGTNRNVGMYAMADIASKQQEGDMVFRELISLARKEGKQDMISSFQKEKEMFDEKAQGMTITIRNIINN